MSSGCGARCADGGLRTRNCVKDLAGLPQRIPARASRMSDLPVLRVRERCSRLRSRLDPAQHAVQARVRIVHLQQRLALRFLQRQAIRRGASPTHAASSNARRRRLGVFAADLFEDALQERPSVACSGRSSSSGSDSHQSTSASSRPLSRTCVGVDAEAAPAADAQVQQAVVAGGEIFDARLRAELRRRRRRADFVADQDQADAEAARFARAFAHEVEVAAFEHAQRQARRPATARCASGNRPSVAAMASHDGRARHSSCSAA